MAQQKMQCAIQRTQNDSQRFVGRENSSTLAGSLERNASRTSSRDSEVPSFAERHPVWTFCTMYSDGQCKIVALPLQCSDHTIHLGSGPSGDQVEMDGFALVSPAAISSVNVEPPKAHRRPGRSFYGSNLQCQLRNKVIARKIIQRNQSLENSLGQISSGSSVPSNEIPSGSNATDSSDACFDIPEVHKTVKQSINSHKRAKSKGKRNKKASRRYGSTELESGHGSSASSSVSMPDISCNGNHFEGKTDDDAINYSETLKKHDEADVSESSSTSELQNLRSGVHSSISESGIEEFAVFDEESELEAHSEDINCLDDVSSSNLLLSEPNESTELDSVSVCSNRNRITSCNYTVQLSTAESARGHVSNSVSEETNMGQHLSGGSVGGSNRGCLVEETNHFVRTKVQENDADECSSYGLNKVNLLQNKNDNVVESNLSSDDGGKKWSKPKASRKLKRKNTPVSKQEYHSYSRKGSHANKASSHESVKMNMRNSERFDVPDKTGGQKGLAGKSSCLRIGIQMLSHAPVQNLYVCPNKQEPNQNERRTVSSSNDQKRTPVGLRDSVPASTFYCNDSLGKSAAKSWTSKKCGDLDLNSQTHPSSINSRLVSTVQSLGHGDGLSSEDNGQTQKLENESTFTGNVIYTNHCTEKSSTRESGKQDKSGLENDENKIVRAVHDAYSAQLASEAVQMSTGRPIAEFEKFLHAASPVVCTPNKITSFQTCSCDEVIRASPCTNEKPSISLGSLWQWYEKHGTYGLEVFAEDYENPNRLGIDRFNFWFYFVPYLSAVQLFRERKRHHSNEKNDIPVTEAVEASVTGEKSENSTKLGELSIFSILIPQPHTEDPSFLQPRNQLCCSEPSSGCNENNESNQPDGSAFSDDPELIFEYFEVDQPQKRRPLFEMIKELVRGDGPSRYRAYGDPTTLDSIDLRDLHPSSWYSVAWYPIYRIPNGKFHAAFLTYHSLGHLVRRSDTANSFGGDSCVASPVVGLQSYNAEDECWFRARQEAELNAPCEILKERMRTLEETAAFMARAVVSKGNATSVNRHPDYEFFLSRRRY